MTKTASRRVSFGLWFQRVRAYDNKRKAWQPVAGVVQQEQLGAHTLSDKHRAELALTSEPLSWEGRSQRLCSAMGSLIILIPWTPRPPIQGSRYLFLKLPHPQKLLTWGTQCFQTSWLWSSKTDTQPVQGNLTSAPWVVAQKGNTVSIQTPRIR